MPFKRSCASTDSRGTSNASTTPTCRDVTIVGKLADPGNGGSERISISGVSFDDLTLFDFEVKTLGEVECPFTFTKYKFIDLI